MKTEVNMFDLFGYLCYLFVYVRFATLSLIITSRYKQVSRLKNCYTLFRFYVCIFILQTEDNMCGNKDNLRCTLGG